jgi:hypothetical protein
MTLSKTSRKSTIFHQIFLLPKSPRVWHRIGFLAHAVARTNQDLKALIGAATEIPGPGFLLPTRNHEVFEWCLSCELKLVFQMTLMTTGLYNEPAGAYLPSILY